MDAELKKKWVEALRSGEYKQGTGWLRKNDKFCCLGVLAAVNGDPLALGADTLHRSRRGSASKYGYWENLIESEDEVALVNMNDQGDSFAEIADYIEANL